MKTFTKLATVAICTAALASNSLAANVSSEDKKIYFGIEGGYSVAAKHKFKERTDDGTVIGKLKGTEVYEGKVGYKFYPGFALELAYALRPSYKLNVWLPDQPDAFAAVPVPGIGGMNNIRSSAKVRSHTVMLNLMYEAQNEKNYRPYFLIGVGYANVTPKKSPITGGISPTAAGIPALNYKGNTNPQIGSIKKFTSHRFGWRVGAGGIYDVTPNIALVAGVKFEMISNIGLHTEYYNPDGSIKKTKSLKKTIGVVDFTVGTRISL